MCMCLHFRQSLSVSVSWGSQGSQSFQLVNHQGSPETHSGNHPCSPGHSRGMVRDQGILLPSPRLLDGHSLAPPPPICPFSSCPCLHYPPCPTLSLPPTGRRSVPVTHFLGNWSSSAVRVLIWKDISVSSWLLPHSQPSRGLHLSKLGVDLYFLTRTL